VTTHDHPPYRFGAFELDVRQRQLRRDGDLVPLRPRPFDLLTVLASRAGELLSKDQLLELAWPGVIVEENNLQVQVSVLRKILGQDSIVTVPGWGYRFALPLLGGDTAGPVAFPPPPRGPGLPAPPVLFGRDEDVARLGALIVVERLVTVLGAGGIGKTRLAQTVARASGAAFESEVSWVDLGHLREGTLLPTQVGTALGIDGVQGQPSPEELARALSQGRRLLVLDNAEHMLAPVVDLVSELLLRAPALHVLATSQAPLHHSAERLFRLEALPVPPAGTEAQEVMRYGAVGMLVDRVRRIDRHFTLTETDAESAAAVCRRLDGIPLAIELAAARVPVIGLSRLVEQLDERFDVLRGGFRDAPDRQQTLSAVLDWSHQLLAPAEQATFRQLGAFAGAFTLRQACSLLMSDSPDTGAFLESLSTLVERSLVSVEAGLEPVYRLPETTRAYALMQLARAGETSVIERASRLYEAEGDRAAAAGANATALAQLVTASDLAALLPEGEARDERELAVSLKLGPAIQSVLGPAHPRCETLYRRARDLASRVGPGERSFKAVWGYWHFLCMGGRNREAAPLAEEIVRMAPQLGDEGLELEAHHAAMTTQDLLGQASQTLDSARRVLAIYNRERHHPLAFAFGGHDPGVCAYGQGALSSWLIGEPDDALSMAADAVGLADTMTDGYSRAAGHFYAGLVYAACGMVRELTHSAERLLRLSDEHGMGMLISEARLLQGRALFDRGDVGTGLAEMSAALAELEGERDLAFILVYISLLADALVAGGRVEEARPYLDRGFGYAGAGQQELFLSELHRLRGDVAEREGQRTLAERWWRQSVEKADAQGARSLALRAAMSAARARGEDVSGDFAGRVAAFAQGRETRDLKDARALLRSFPNRPALQD